MRAQRGASGPGEGGNRAAGQPLHPSLPPISPGHSGSWRPGGPLRHHIGQQGESVESASGRPAGTSSGVRVMMPFPPLSDPGSLLAPVSPVHSGGVPLAHGLSSALPAHSLSPGSCQTSGHCGRAWKELAVTLRPERGRARRRWHGCPGGGGMAVRGARLPGASCRPLLGTPGSRLSEMVMVILLLPCVDAVPTLNWVCYK